MILVFVEFRNLELVAYFLFSIFSFAIFCSETIESYQAATCLLGALGVAMPPILLGCSKDSWP